MMKIRKWLSLFAAALAICVGIAGWQGYWPAASVAQSAPSSAPSSENVSLSAAGLKLEELGRGIYGLVASADFPFPAGAAICNGGFVIGSDGVLIIDPFQTPALGNLMLATVKTLTDKPVKYVLNTHYHFDHTGGNPAAIAQGIPIMGRGLIREFIAGKNKPMDPNPKLPDIVVNSETEIWLGDRQVKIERVEGHSGGTDLVAYVPDAKVLFAGDMLFKQAIPFVGDGNIRQWQGSLYRLIATYPDAKVLPGHGPVGDVKDLQALQAFFAELEKLAYTWKAQGLTKDQAVSQYAKVPDAYKGYKFQTLYAPNTVGFPSDLEVAYDQFARSSSIPLLP